MAVNPLDILTAKNAGTVGTDIVLVVAYAFIDYMTVYQHANEVLALLGKAVLVGIGVVRLVGGIRRIMNRKGGARE